MIDEKLLRLIRDAHQPETWDDIVRAHNQAGAISLLLIISIFVGLIAYAAFWGQ